MLGPIKKAMRYLRREYPSGSIAATIGLTIGAGIGTAVTFGAAAPLFVIPLAAAGGAAAVAGMNEVVGGEWDRVSDNSIELNGYKLVGHKRDLSSIKMTQVLIDNKTKKLKHLPELPAKLRKKLLAHVEDVQDALARVRVYKGYRGEQVQDFTFKREYYDSRGSLTEQDFAQVRFTPAAQGKPEQAEVIDKTVKAAPAPLPKTDVISAEFGSLSKKVEDVAKRVGKLENPAPEPLNKPKLSKPTA